MTPETFERPPVPSSEAPARPPLREHRPGSRRRPLLRGTAALLLLLVSVIVVGAAFVSLYDDPEATAYTGSDTPWYVWRARLVAGHGLDALPGAEPDPFRAQAHRAAHPLVASVLDSAGVDPERLAYALPAVIGVMAGLAAGALAVRALREPMWAFPVYGVVVGASLNMTIIAVGRTDTLLMAGLTVAAAATALVAAEGRGGAAAPVLLLAAAAAVHWPFALLFSAVLLGLALVLLPGSVAAWRHGASPGSTPSARLGLVLGGGAAGAAAALALAPAAPAPPRGGVRLVRLLEEYGPRFGGLALVPALGAVALAFPADAGRRRGLLLAVLWAGTAVVAVAALLAGFVVPAHRILPFALGIPILAAAAVTGLGRLLSRIPPRVVGRAVAVAAVSAALVGSLAVARSGWELWPQGRGQELAEARAAGRYLSAVGGDRPVVFVVDLPGRLRGAFHTIRSVLPEDALLRSYAYVGTVENLLAGRPTLRTDGDNVDVYNANSLNHWQGVRRVLQDDPMVLSLAAFHRGRPDRDPEGTPVAPGVLVVRGPVPDDLPPLSSEPQPVPPSAEIGRSAATALLLLFGVGLGWAFGLVPGGWLPRLGVAPALGMAVLILSGLLGSRLGLAGPGSWLWVAAAAAALGWAPVAAAAMRRRGRGDHRPAPRPAS